MFTIITIIGLRQNCVDLSENYQQWNKDTMIQKIGMVMGLDWVVDPDDSYVLTVDNVIKILAIHMRFRLSDTLQESSCTFFLEFPRFVF